MNKLRIIARVDVKNEFAIKGIHLEGLRKVGLPNQLALNYYNQNIDEIIFMDAVASYYDRNTLGDLTKAACLDIFVPITVGGGIRNIADIKKALKNGSDKVAINTAAVKDPNFINQAAKIFGSQCIVSSIEAKKIGINKWEVYTDNGREPTGIDVVLWAKKVQSLGAGEILLTSIDKDGTKKGFDLDLCKAVENEISIPLIVSGGMGNNDHIIDLIKSTSVDGVAIGSVLHYEIESVSKIKQHLLANECDVRI